MVPASPVRRVQGPSFEQAAVNTREERFARTAPWRSRWDQAGAEYVASDSEWCDRLSARLIALVAGLDYPAASVTALELACNSALRALAPERVAEDLARTRAGRADVPAQRPHR